MKPIVKFEITAYLPLDPKMAGMLDYLTNVSAKSIAEFAGSKYTEEEWKAFRSAIQPTITGIKTMSDRCKDIASTPVGG